MKNAPIEAIIEILRGQFPETAATLRKHFNEECCRRFLDGYASASGFRFSIELSDEWRDFTGIRNRVVGIFLNSVGKDSGLSFSRGFVDDSGKARDEIAAILTKRRRGLSP